MMLSVAVLPGEVVIRLPPTQDPDAEVFAVGVSLIHPGQQYGPLSYEDLCSLGDGLWELPDDPSTWTLAKAKRIEFELPKPDSDPAEAPSDPVPTS